VNIYSKNGWGQNGDRKCGIAWNVMKCFLATGIVQAGNSMECEYCQGCGGFDAARDVEVYDQWISCEYCEGTGERDE
jgi:hypothetical protein